MSQSDVKCYLGLIVQVDKTLMMIRAEWMKTVKASADQAKWSDRLDTMLAERFKLMQARDEAYEH